MELSKRKKGYQERETVIYWNGLIEKLVNTDEIVIYGAGAMGRAVKRCLEDAPYHIKIRSFLVSSMQNNPDHIEGIPVIDLARASVFQEKMILVALHEKNMPGVLEQLRKAGFGNCFPLSFDSDEWSDIRGNWFLHMSRIGGENYLDLQEALTRKMRIYVVRHVADRALKKEMPDRCFEVSIQAGAALTEKRIAAVLDNQGENISKKNKKYCELTALYWIWKHETADYLGLSHYRRRFDISEQMIVKLPESDIDVVVTAPIFNIRGVGQQYGVDHRKADWDICMKTVGEMFPQYKSVADKIEKGNYYYAYNMLMARREILNQYCEWLFPILFRCESEIGEREDPYQGRYIGFLAERLMTIFLEKHKKEFKLAVAKKHFIMDE